MKSLSKYFFIILATLTLTSCKEDNVNKPFISESGTCLIESLKAIDHRDDKNAKIWLKRMLKNNAKDSFALTIMNYEDRRIVANKVNTMISENTVLKNADLLSGTDPLYKPYNDLPTIFFLIEQATKENTWNDAEKLSNVIKNLAGINHIVQAYPSLITWQENAKKRLSQLIVEEQFKHAYEALKILDNEVANKRETTNWLEISKQNNMPSNIEDVLIEVVKKSQPNMVYSQLKKLPENLQLKFSEILIYANALPNNLAADYKITTSCGFLLKAENLYNKNQYKEMYEYVKNPKSPWHTLDNQTKQTLFENLKIRSSIFNTIIWKKEAPGVIDILDRAFLWLQEQ